MDIETNRENINNNSNRSTENSSRDESGFRKFRSFKIPVKVGEEYDVKIEAMSKRGDSGVAKIEGMVIFVANTKEGDQVKIKIKRVGMGYAIADVVQQEQQ
ncbi:MAG TPA: TRAM domain-containing protein [Nitrososphaeraceae archaeon]|jgi:predicted RNA-binding protein with TRAM domain|nr:TRAM domain-containing protein [Nitrososphaeraceae archaeon]HEU5172745.1 TRAM domain-containing protein [Nitrososphaeraceae archaeon]